MRIGEMSEKTGVASKTLRFWEGEGLMPSPTRTPSGYRSYEPEALERVSFIRQAQTAGFTLDQIRQILDVSDSGRPPCEHVATFVDHRLAEIDRRLAELKRTRKQLVAISKRAVEQDPVRCRGFCSIITG